MSQRRELALSDRIGRVVPARQQPAGLGDDDGHGHGHVHGFFGPDDGDPLDPLDAFDPLDPFATRTHERTRQHTGQHARSGGRPRTPRGGVPTVPGSPSPAPMPGMR